MAAALNNIAFEVSSDEDYVDEAQIPRPRWIRERHSYFDEYDDVDFKTRFRMSKETTLSILEQIEEQLEFPSNRYVKCILINLHGN